MCREVDRVAAQCLGDHRFHSCPGLIFFFCPMLVSLLIISSFTFFNLIKLQAKSEKERSYLLNMQNILNIDLQVAFGKYFIDFQSFKL